jgi:hypothetical protein
LRSLAVTNGSKRRKLTLRPVFMKFCSFVVALGAMFFALTMAHVQAAELVMFEQPGCAWCLAFDREIAPAYGKTDEGRRAPLRRVDMRGPLPDDLSFIAAERLTPLFVLVDKGREIGRIRGYPGEDHFWGLLGVLIKKLDQSSQATERALPGANSFHAKG